MHNLEAMNTAAAGLCLDRTSAPAGEPDADSITAVIASHYLDAHAAAGPDDDAGALAARAVDLLEQAAAQARGVGAPAEALHHLQSALALVDDPVVVGRLTEAAALASIAAFLRSRQADVFS